MSRFDIVVTFRATLAFKFGALVLAFRFDRSDFKLTLPIHDTNSQQRAKGKVQAFVIFVNREANWAVSRHLSGSG